MLYSGKLIGNIRNQENIKLATLAQGLCSTSQLARIESGVRSAEKLLFDSLYERLGKYSGRFTVLLDYDEYEKLQARIMIYNYIDNGNYEEAQNTINVYRRNTKNNIHRQFLCLAECEIMHKSNTGINECMKKLMEGIRYTYPEFDIDSIGKYYLSRMEMLMAQQYIRYIEMSGENNRAAKLYHEVLTSLECDRYDRTEREILYRHVGYWLMRHYIDIGEYYKALEIGEKTYAYIVSGKMLVFLLELREGIIQCREAIGEDMSYERRKFLILRNMNEKYGVKHAEDYFPRYAEGHAVNVNDVIRQRRVMYGMTQEKLADGICDVTTISRVENNRHKLNDILRVQILQRLHLSGDKYVSCVDTYDYTIFEVINKINDASMGAKHFEVKKILTDMYLEYKLSTNNSIQFMVRVKEMQADNKESAKEIINALRLTLILEKCTENMILFENEWGLIDDLVFYYEKNKEYDKAAMYALMLKPPQMEAMTNDYVIKKIIACVRNGDLMGELGKVETAGRELLEAINLSVKVDTIARIPALTYIYAWNLIEKKDKITDSEKLECAEMLQYSYILSSMFDNQKRIDRVKKLWNKIFSEDINLFC